MIEVVILGVGVYLVSIGLRNGLVWLAECILEKST